MAPLKQVKFLSNELNKDENGKKF